MIKIEMSKCCPCPSEAAVAPASGVAAAPVPTNTLGRLQSGVGSASRLVKNYGPGAAIAAKTVGRAVPGLGTAILAANLATHYGPSAAAAARSAISRVAPGQGQPKQIAGKSRRMTRTTRRRGGAIKVPDSPAPLSSVNTYTSWPGGVDPTAKLYQAPKMIGGKRKTRRNTRGVRMSRRSRHRR
jgi:hypothetical protein